MKQLTAWLPTFNLSDKPIWYRLECEASGGESPWLSLFGIKSKTQKEHPIISAAKPPLTPLWNNKRIPIGRESVDWPQWHKKGIFTVQDLLDMKTNRYLNFD